MITQEDIDAMGDLDISKEVVEALAVAADCDLCCVDTAATLRAQAEMIKDLEADRDAGLRREKDANERAMKHLRRAENAEIASKNHAAFSHEWRERAEKAEAENGILRTEKHADAEAIASARNDALREAADRIDRKIRAIQPEMTRRAQRLAAGKKPGFQYAIHRADLDARMSDRDAILALIEGDTNDAV